MIMLMDMRRNERQAKNAVSATALLFGPTVASPPTSIPSSTVATAHWAVLASRSPPSVAVCPLFTPSEEDDDNKADVGRSSILSFVLVGTDGGKCSPIKKDSDA